MAKIDVQDYSGKIIFKVPSFENLEETLSSTKDLGDQFPVVFRYTTTINEYDQSYHITKNFSSSNLEPSLRGTGNLLASLDLFLNNFNLAINSSLSPRYAYGNFAGYDESGIIFNHYTPSDCVKNVNITKTKTATGVQVASNGARGNIYEVKATAVKTNTRVVTLEGTKYYYYFYSIKNYLIEYNYNFKLPTNYNSIKGKITLYDCNNIDVKYYNIFEKLGKLFTGDISLINSRYSSYRSIDVIIPKGTNKKVEVTMPQESLLLLKTKMIYKLMKENGMFSDDYRAYLYDPHQDFIELIMGEKARGTTTNLPVDLLFLDKDSKFGTIAHELGHLFDFEHCGEYYSSQLNELSWSYNIFDFVKDYYHYYNGNYNNITSNGLKIFSWAETISSLNSIYITYYLNNKYDANFIPSTYSSIGKFNTNNTLGFVDGIKSYWQATGKLPTFKEYVERIKTCAQHTDYEDRKQVAKYFVPYDRWDDYYND